MSSLHKLSKIMEERRIVFMGTPLFAQVCLSHLVEQNFQVVAVVTAPDKPAGRGQQLHESEVKKYAISKALPLFQPANLKDEQFLKELATIQADLFVVVAFRMLPELVWSMPKYGTINLHASLLPQYRGAAPINWAIINGEKETGVSTFLIEKEIDTGSLLASARVGITPNMNVGELHDALLDRGKWLLTETIQGVFSSSITAKAQSTIPVTQLKSAPKIFKSDCQIDWNVSAAKIHNKIRGLSPFPGAWTYLKLGTGVKLVKLFASERMAKLTVEKPGTIKVDAGCLYVAAADEWVEIKELQIEGKKRMDAKAFVLGANLSNAYFE
jgi:methionyl-tRNA formyltransferase